MRKGVVLCCGLLLGCGTTPPLESSDEEENSEQDDSEGDTDQPMEPAAPAREDVRIEPLAVEECSGDLPACVEGPLEACTLRCFQVSRRCRASVEFWPLLLGPGTLDKVDHVGSGARFVYFTLDQDGSDAYLTLYHWSPAEGVQSLPDLFFPSEDIDNSFPQFRAAARDADVLLYRHYPTDDDSETGGFYLWRPGSSPEPLDFAGLTFSADGQHLLGIEYEEMGNDVVVRDAQGNITPLGLTFPPEAYTPEPDWLGLDGTVVMSQAIMDHRRVFFRSATTSGDSSWQDIGSLVPLRTNITAEPPLNDATWEELSSKGSTTLLREIVADGQVLVGETGNNSLYQRPFRWTPSKGLRDLSFEELPPDSTYSQTRASQDGRVVAGVVRQPPQGSAEFPERVYRWTEEGGMETILDAEQGKYADLLYVSSQGDVIWASRDLPGGQALEAFRWTVDGGLEAVGDVRPGRIAQDGDLLMTPYETDKPLRSFSAEIDPLDLSPLLTEPWLPEGWSGSANHVAEDGRLLMGGGQSPTGESEHWLLRRVDSCEQ